MQSSLAIPSRFNTLKNVIMDFRYQEKSDRGEIIHGKPNIEYIFFSDFHLGTYLLVTFCGIVIEPVGTYSTSRRAIDRRLIQKDLWTNFN